MELGLKEISVAEARSIEVNPETGEVFLIFKVIDEDFKKDILRDFSKDYELRMRKIDK